MANCDTCGRLVLAGMIEDGDLRYCSERCYRLGKVREQNPMSKALVIRAAQELSTGACPKCQGPGPLDVHLVHSLLSAVFVRFSRRQPMLSCRRCARKKQALSTVATLFLGWWSISGLFLTPVYIGRNIAAMRKRETDSPSTELLEWAYWDLVRRHEGQVLYFPVDEEMYSRRAEAAAD